MPQSLDRRSSSAAPVYVYFPIKRLGNETALLLDRCQHFSSRLSQSIGPDSLPGESLQCRQPLSGPGRCVQPLHTCAGPRRPHPFYTFSRKISDGNSVYRYQSPAPITPSCTSNVLLRYTHILQKAKPVLMRCAKLTTRLEPVLLGMDTGRTSVMP